MVNMRGCSGCKYMYVLNRKHSTYDEHRCVHPDYEPIIEYEYYKGETEFYPECSVLNRDGICNKFDNGFNWFQKRYKLKKFKNGCKYCKYSSCGYCFHERYIHWRNHPVPEYYGKDCEDVYSYHWHQVCEFFDNGKSESEPTQPPPEDKQPPIKNIPKMLDDLDQEIDRRG